MRYTIATTNKFERSVQKCVKRGLDIAKLKAVIIRLADIGTLPRHYRPHKLSGKYAGYWECHIEPDWLLVWEQNETELVLLFVDTGTHADLF